MIFTANEYSRLLD